MCGRYSLTTPMEAVRQLFNFPERPNLAARVNIAPSQEVAAVRLGAGRVATRHLVALRWGLIPSWAKEPGIGNRMINARAETLAEKPAFRAAFRRRRCLIPADGFYEWKTERGRKQPYRITLKDGAPFAFAGLWERWEGPRGGAGGGAGGDGAGEGAVESCTIITTEAKARLQAIHHRTPVILAPEAYDLWLDPAAPGDQAQALLGPAPSEWFACFRVSPKINSPANDDPALIEPLDEAAGAAGTDEVPEPPDPQPRLL